MIAVIFGIQGVGKSTLVKTVIEKRPNIKRLYWGEMALNEAKKQGLVEKIDEIRTLTVPVQKKLQKIVGKEISDTINNDRSKDYIIETHAALKTKQGFMPGFTKEMLEEIKPDIFVVIESHAMDIYHRRIFDTERKRDHDKSVKEIQLNLDATRWFASNFCIATGANLLIVENIEDNVNVAVDTVVEALDLYK